MNPFAERRAVLDGGDLDGQDRSRRTPALAGSSSATSAFGYTAELAEAFARTGRIAEGAALGEAGYDQSEAGWIAPELLRLRGERLLSPGASAAAAPTTESASTTGSPTRHLRVTSTRGGA